MDVGPLIGQSTSGLVNERFRFSDIRKLEPESCSLREITSRAQGLGHLLRLLVEALIGTSWALCGVARVVNTTSVCHATDHGPATL